MKARARVHRAWRWLAGALTAGVTCSCKAPHRLSPGDGAAIAPADPKVTIAGQPLAGPTASAAPSSDAPAALCGPAGETLVFVSPAVPVRGQPLRAVAVTEREVDALLTFQTAGLDAGVEPTAQAERRQGGPPYTYLLEIPEAAAGKAQISFVRESQCGGELLAKREVTVLGSRGPRSPAPKTVLWPTRRAFTLGFENLYSAWVARLFAAPLQQQPTWPALDQVLRDPTRNFLFDHLGLGEDGPQFAVRPDCADLPYFLRAYFAFKLRLPFGFSRCTRLESGAAPRCAALATNEDPFPTTTDDVREPIPPWADPERPDGSPWEDEGKRFNAFLQTTLADAAQSAAGRTAPDDEQSDYYPVSLSAATLRPGTIFADPYGHVLVVTARIPETEAGAGVLLAVDGQPDGTVARKRFWRGNFLFSVDPTLGSAGFKRFRPLMRSAGGPLVRVKNAELRDFSASDQYSAGATGFYDKMDDVLSPTPLDPSRALLETVLALDEQVKARVVSVENGRVFRTSGRLAEMPEGPKLFETTGDWEAFSTPSRDLRLLIAFDVAQAMPANVARRPTRYRVPPGQSLAAVQSELEERLRGELRDRKFRYTRSDGSPWELSLSDLLQRASALEMAYDPNDCVEVRWGAPPGSEEAAPCRDRAPIEQRNRMLLYRPWFRDRARPLR